MLYIHCHFIVNINVSFLQGSNVDLGYCTCTSSPSPHLDRRSSSRSRGKELHLFEHGFGVVAQPQPTSLVGDPAKLSLLTVCGQWGEIPEAKSLDKQPSFFGKSEKPSASKHSFQILQRHEINRLRIISCCCCCCCCCCRRRRRRRCPCHWCQFHPVSP